MEAWNDQCIKDPLLNKALQPPKEKRQKTNQNSTGQPVVAQEETKTEEANQPETAQRGPLEEQKIVDTAAEPKALEPIAEEVK